jgi:hypothetical protein
MTNFLPHLALLGHCSETHVPRNAADSSPAYQVGFLGEFNKTMGVQNDEKIKQP